MYEHQKKFNSRSASHPPRARRRPIPRCRAVSRRIVERLLVYGRVFEPGQKVERLAEIAAMIELARSPAGISGRLRRDGNSPRKWRAAPPASDPTKPMISGSGSAPLVSPRRVRARPARHRARSSRRARHSEHGWRRPPDARTLRRDQPCRDLCNLSRRAVVPGPRRRATGRARRRHLEDHGVWDACAVSTTRH
jgi:hypothetical protein